MGCYSSARKLALLVASTALLANARNADTESSFAECYQESGDTYGELDLDGYRIDWPQKFVRFLLIVTEGKAVDVSLDTATEVDRQTYTTACADICTATSDCFAFLVAYNNCAKRECQMLTADETYKLTNEEAYWDTPVQEKIAFNFKQLYFKENPPCAEGKHVMYIKDEPDMIILLELGCNDLIAEGNFCHEGDTSYVNAHGDQVCADGSECISMASIVGRWSNINGWREMLASCESQATIDKYTKLRQDRDIREARADADIESGKYEELTSGDYTVANYKTLRSKLGNTIFEYRRVLFSDDFEAVSALSGADTFSTADAYAQQCADACDTKTGCMGFTIVWQADYAGANMCYMIVQEIELYEYRKDSYDNSVFVGQVFVPKQYSHCPADEILVIGYLYTTYNPKVGIVRFSDCKDSAELSSQLEGRFCLYDATNKKYLPCDGV